MSTLNTSRREFLGGAFLTRAGRAAVARRDRPWGPAPPWMDSVGITGVCTQCDHPCVSACEAEILRVHPQDHSAAGVPYLSFESRGCTYCGSCADACPVFLNLPMGRPVLGQALLDPSTCLAWRQVLCISCKGHCPDDAIAWDDRWRPSIVRDACSGCGACVGICPAQAITVECNA